MKELNPKLIISIAVGLLAIGISFIIFFPSTKSVETKLPTITKEYTPIEIREGLVSSSDWPQAKEQAKGEMFDLFTPPEIFIDQSGEFVFRPPYAITPKGPFGIHLLEINLEPYRFQLEGFVEEVRNNQSLTRIILHSVEDGKTLLLRPNQQVPKYDLKLLDWRVDRKFNDDENTEVIAWLKLKDGQSNRIINLRHDEQLYEDSVEIVFEESKSREIYVLRGVKSSFFIGDVEYLLNEVDYEKSTVSMSKLIPESDAITETLAIHIPTEASSAGKLDADAPLSIEEAFNSF